MARKIPPPMRRSSKGLARSSASGICIVGGSNASAWSSSVMTSVSSLISLPIEMTAGAPASLYPCVMMLVAISERAQFSDRRGRLQRRNRDRAARAVGGDGHFAFENQHGAAARLSLEHEDRAWFEGPDFAGFDQKRNVGFGEVEKGARGADGGAQRRGRVHFSRERPQRPALASNSRTSRLWSWS